MGPVLFSLFSLMLKHSFGDIDTGVKVQISTSGGLFNHQKFADDAVLIEPSALVFFRAGGIQDTS